MALTLSQFVRRMRRLFGHSKSSSMAAAAATENHNNFGGTANNGAESGGGRKTKRKGGGGIPSFLRKSNSAREEGGGGEGKKGGAEQNHQQDGGGGGGRAMLLAAPAGSSRTFDVNSRSPHSADFPCPTASSSVLSGCYPHSAPLLLAREVSDLADGDLDRQLMQTCTDVKYVNRRPGKCTAVVDANFQRQCLQAHNYVRQVYSFPPLLWSQELAGLAKTWALKLAERGRILYPELPGIGENIFLLAGAGNDRAESPANSIGDHLTTGMELVAVWAEEARKVDFGKPRWSNETKHFTQMMWRSALEMGVARHWNTAKDCLAIVAFYRPAGNSNLPGEFGANLPCPAEVPEDGFQCVTLSALIAALNRNDLGDGGFRKGPLPPIPRPFAGPPNTTKILKSTCNSQVDDQ